MNMSEVARLHRGRVDPNNVDDVLSRLLFDCFGERFYEVIDDEPLRTQFREALVRRLSHRGAARTATGKRTGPRNKAAPA